MVVVVHLRKSGLIKRDLSKRHPPGSPMARQPEQHEGIDYWCGFAMDATNGLAPRELGLRYGLRCKVAERAATIWKRAAEGQLRLSLVTLTDLLKEERGVLEDMYSRLRRWLPQAGEREIESIRQWLSAARSADAVRGLWAPAQLEAIRKHLLQPARVGAVGMVISAQGERAEVTSYQYRSVELAGCWRDVVLLALTAYTADATRQKLDWPDVAADSSPDH